MCVYWLWRVDGPAAAYPSHLVATATCQLRVPLYYSPRRLPAGRGAPVSGCCNGGGSS